MASWLEAIAHCFTEFHNPRLNGDNFFCNTTNVGVVTIPIFSNLTHCDVISILMLFSDNATK